MAATQQAKVKSVLSGDTLILTAIGNPKKERTLSLAFVSAPRLRREGDEPFAVESRDFIRRQLVGKVIQFRVLYKLPTGNQREYGQITLQDTQQLPELSVANGYLKLRDDAAKREEPEEAKALIEKLRVLEARAKADEKGLWDSTTPKVQTSYELPNPKDFVQRVKGQQLDAVVEKVLTGDRLIVRLKETPTQHFQTMLLIAGVRAPKTKQTTGGDEPKETPAEPYGEEAHEFIESRLLQRNVVINVLGVSPQNQLVGSVKHPNGDIAVFLLKAGFARCVDHHSTLLGQDMGLLRQAENFAKAGKLGLFRGMAAPKAIGQESEVVVSRVMSADTLFLRYPDGREKRYNLSSVRQPKPSDPKQSPFGADAKEFMRKRLIGKHVKLSVDGKRAATEGFDEREMATVTQNGINVGLTLVESGYASVLRHRMDDPDRSPVYDDLMLAESAAQQEGRGMWSAKAADAKQYIDYSENVEKAKRLLTLLTRQKRVPAIVDFVKGASRFTLLVPRENAKLTFVLSGIQAPKSARNATDQSEPFGREAHDLANRRCLQRDVEIDVEDTDKVGGFIGKLYVNRENFAKTLLEEGFATVRTYSAEKSGNAAELLAAERSAKDARRGRWHDYDPSQDVEETNGANGATDAEPHSNGASNGQQAPPSRDYRDVVVTHVEDTCRLKIQQVGPSSTGALASLMTAFRSFHISNSTSLPGPPKAGDFVAAKFSDDGEWYRARIRRNDRDAKTAEVVYVDYGNSESVAWSALRPLGALERFGTTALKTQALDAALSFVQFPSGSSEYMDEAQAWLMRRCVLEGKQLVARVDHTDQRDGTLFVTLFDAETSSDEGASMNAEVVEEGLGMVGRKLSYWEKSQGRVLEGLKTREKEAMDERRGMWEYGDLTDA